MPEQEVAPKKEGVHGWRAFLLMLGCGSFSALLIVGLVVGGLRLFISSAGSSSSEDSDDPAPTWQAPESLDVGVIDVCEKTIETLSDINVPQRLDDGSNYVDTGEDNPDAEGRVISDECSWELNPMASSMDSWDFDFEYYSFITPDGGEEPEGLAENRFSKLESDLSAGFGGIDQEGSEDIRGDSFYLYRGSDGESRYVLLRRIRTSVYVISMESDSRSVGRQAFWNEVENIVNPVDFDLERWAPE